MTTSYYKLINNQTTHQLSSNKYHRWTSEEYLIYLVTKNTLIKLQPHIIKDLNSVASMKIFNSRQYPHQEEILIKKLYGSIRHILSMWKPTSVEYFYVSLASTNCDIISTVIYSIETVLRSANPTPIVIKECSCHH